MSDKKEAPRDGSAKKEASRGSSAKKEASRGSSAKKEVPRDSSDKKEASRGSSSKEEAQRDTSDKKEAPQDRSAKKEASIGSSVKKSKKYSPSPASPTHPSPPSSSLPRSLSPSHSPSYPLSASHSPSSNPPKGGNDESASFCAKSPHLELNVLCWNIMGGSAPEYNEERKKITTTTFEELGPDTNIICIQEMKFDPKPSGTATCKYLPDSIFKDYKQSKRKEDRSNTFNAVFFREKMFREIINRAYTTAEIINRAYRLIDIKWRIYHEISEKADIEKAEKGTLAPFEGYRSGDKERMFREVVEKYTISSAYNVIKYRQQRDTVKSSEEKSSEEKSSEEKSLKNHLDDRMAISCLQMISNLDYEFVVVSLHNISKGGKSKSKSYAYLIFDFLEKLKMPVVIAGDFNCDITEGAKAAGYLIVNYKLDTLRDRPSRGRIDFIAVKNLKSSPFNFKISTTNAHRVGDGSASEGVTNHNPLTATILLIKEEC